jgi:hypothetical protein
MWIRALLVLCTLALSWGCGGARGMRTETAPVYAPASGLASVVFARHTNFGGPINFVAVDQRRKFVAGMKGKAHAVSMLPPGEYVFYIIAENTDVIHATLEAGRTYVIEARVRMGFWKAQVTAESVRRGTPRFAEAPHWVQGTPALVPDGNSGQAWVDGHDDNIAKRISKVQSNWAKKDPSWQAQHTLSAEDGYLPDEFNVTVTAAN